MTSLVGGVGAAIVLAGGWLIARADGLAGAAMALALAGVSVASLKLFVNSVVPTNSNLPKASGATVAVILVKLPLVAILIYLATRLSMPGLYCFLGTLGLVYSAVVWRLSRIDR